MGIPFSPPGGGAGGPGQLPVLPGQDPYDLDRYGTTSDPNDWQLWWKFNQDRFLQFTNIQTGETYSGSDGFYLGKGQEDKSSIGGRASDDIIDGVLAQTLMEGLQKGGSIEFCKSALVAMSKVGGEHQPHYSFVTKWFLAEGMDELHPTAAFVTGLNGGEREIPLLRNIALNTVEGCKAVSPEGKPVTARVPMEIRAYAAYGLGMIGSRSPKESVRQDIVKTLVEIIENDAAEANDTRVAAMIAMGMVPLSIDQDVVACYCGTCVVPDPHTSLRPQVTYLLRYFTATKEFDPILRSHTATTLARLVASRPDGMSDRMKEGVAEVLVRALRKSSRQPENVRESAVLALGLIGDADNDNIDQWIRWAIRRSLKGGGDMEQRFAMISLAEIGGHRGSGDEPFGALGEIRGALKRELSAGKKRMKPWAALSVGLLGFELRAKGQMLDPALDNALSNVIRSGKKVDDLGAYALAAGMRGTADLSDRLLGKLPKTRDDAACGYVAMGLGMLGGNVAAAPLQKAFAKAEGKPLLQTRVGLALGLLGEGSVVEELLECLAAAEEELRAVEDDDEKGTLKAEAGIVAAVTALGFIGDKRGVEAIAKIALDADSDFTAAAREAAVVALGFVGDRTSRSWRTALTLGANYRARTATLTTGEGAGVLDLK